MDSTPMATPDMELDNVIGNILTGLCEVERRSHMAKSLPV